MKVLYVCRANIGRSQIAESYHNSLLDLKAESTGIKVFERSGLRLNQLINKINNLENVILVIDELGIDVSENNLK